MKLKIETLNEILARNNFSKFEPKNNKLAKWVFITPPCYEDKGSIVLSSVDGHIWEKEQGLVIAAYLILKKDIKKTIKRKKFNEDVKEVIK